MPTDEAPFIKNKFAQLVVGVLCADYPHAWPQVFAQLLACLPNGPVANPSPSPSPSPSPNRGSIPNPGPSPGPNAGPNRNSSPNPNPKS